MATPNRRRAKQIDPITYFSGWAYNVKRAQWPALGVNAHEYIDKLRTEHARAEATSRGTPADAVKRIKVMYTAHAVMTPPDYDFHDFDLFDHAGGDGWIQVVSADDASAIEVHRTFPGEKRRAYVMSAHHLEHWLRTGQVEESRRILASQSRSEVLRYQIANPSD